MKLRQRLLAASFLILFAAAPAESASVKLVWEPAGDRSVAGYRIHYGSEPGRYTQTVQVQGRLTANAVIESLEDGKTYFFAITSYDAKGKESSYSPEITTGSKNNQKPSRAVKSGDRAGQGKASNIHAPKNEKTGPPEGQAPEHKKISHSRSVAKTQDGKILPSR